MAEERILLELQIKLLKKLGNMLTETEKLEKEILRVYGFNELMLGVDYMA